MEFITFLPYIVLIFSQIIRPLKGLIIKSVSISPMYQLFINTFVLLLPSLIVCLIYQRVQHTDDIKLLFVDKEYILIGISQFIGLLALTICFKLLPISYIIPMLSMISISTVLFDKYLNDDDINIGQLGSFFITIIGIIIISVYTNTSSSKDKKNISTKNNFIIGITCMIFLIIWTGLKYAILKKKLPSKEKKYEFEEINYTILSMSLIPTILSFILCIILTILNIYYPLSFTHPIVNLKIPSIKNILICSFGYFVVLYIRYLCMYYGYDNMNISTFSIISNLQIVSSLVIGYLFLKEKITISKIIGCIIIIIGICLEIYFKEQDDIKKI